MPLFRGFHPSLWGVSYERQMGLIGFEHRQEGLLIWDNMDESIINNRSKTWDGIIKPPTINQYKYTIKH
jgi:hypothetical protein